MHPAVTELHRRSRALKRALRACRNLPLTPPEFRLLATAEREVRTLPSAVDRFPATGSTARVVELAREYLHRCRREFNEDLLVEFLRSAPHDLLMGEIWAMKPALQLELLESTMENPAPVLLDSLRIVGEANWKELFERASRVHEILLEDPAGAYGAMEFESREEYRTQVAELARHSRCSEEQVARDAVQLASRGSGRRGHVGFYLIDKGVPRLRTAIAFRPPFSFRLRDWIRDNATLFYLAGIEIITLTIVYALLEGLDSLTPVFAGFFLLLIPATQAAVDFMNNLTSSLVGPRPVPKLDLSEGIPDDAATMVAVPALLINERQVDDLIDDLEIRYLANRDPNLYFALLTDSPDSDQPLDDRDLLATGCLKGIEALNRRYGTNGRTPFYLFHRHRTYNPSEGRWMGWERKRGKLLDLNQVLRGGYDPFPVKCGDESVFPRIRYVIALDADTQLPRDAARRLIGAIAHPLNRAVIHPRTQMVVEGYGILQPRIGVSIQSAARSWLANIYSGQTGFDIYTRAISDVYQDLFGEGIFTGKGIYDVDALRATLEHRFPENALLSHDLIEGSYARVALVSDIELIDDYPTHFSAYNRRKHRWLRGDWQIIRWIFSRVPDRLGRLVPNPISLISRWKILDNLRRSLFDPAAVLLLLCGWFYLPGNPVFWTGASIAMLLMPPYAGLFFSLLRVPVRSLIGLRAWLRDTLENFGREHMMVLLHVLFLLHDALLAGDAIARSLLRVFVTHKRLLEWETAAEAEARIRRSAIDRYLRWSPWIAAAVGAALWVVRPTALPVALPVLAAWLLAPVISRWLGSLPPADESTLQQHDTLRLRLHALRIWRFFLQHSHEGNNWLIPDNTREDGPAAERLSPTNLGLLLNARIAAVHFGYITLVEFAELTRRTLDTLKRIHLCNGHLLNWYDNATLRRLEPQFVSTVDSGNLIGSLWTLKQAALEWLSRPPDTALLEEGLDDMNRLIAGSAGDQAVWWIAERDCRLVQLELWREQRGLTPELAQLLAGIADDAGELAAAMDMRFLYNRRRKVLSVGYNIPEDRLEPSTYDLLASESRMASFSAIAKGDIPQESWFHLGRSHTLAGSDRVLVSWTGTMFEYLMPALWMRTYPETIMHDSMRAAVRVQQRYGRKHDVPWGISESACESSHGGDYDYAPFGVPDLATRRQDGRRLVISPYSTFLALMVDPAGAIENLRVMESLGWLGECGFYEAAEYVDGQPRLIRSWMAHHQAMSLLALCNVLCGEPLRKYFHAEPHVLATERLLHERVPRAMEVERLEIPEPVAVEAVAST